MISPVPSNINLSTPPPRPPSNGHFTPQPEQSDYPANEGWQWQEDIWAWDNCHHVLSPMGFKHQSPSGTRWLEDLFCSKQPKFHLISTFDSSELTVPPFVEPSQMDEPPIPGPSQSSSPPEDVLTREPEAEVAPTQSMEEPFVKSQHHFFYSSQLFLTFPLTISSLSHSTPLHHHHQQYARWIPSFPLCSPSLPVQSFPLSHNEARQEFTDLQQTLIIPQAIVHKSIKQILLEHC
ncbi:hypothetical protein O181_027685 [Austropuccinia psidii MF-1]|uniref:Uncharacterized protein n=1 Tax=Austropuccinia psidii MF-1 TaxID=1389203 RepID=A0A9Q3CRV0_9BASI|nr:hypothetical protein [Austropuccinia psidii MF-1]